MDKKNILFLCGVRCSGKSETMYNHATNYCNKNKVNGLFISHRNIRETPYLKFMHHGKVTNASLQGLEKTDVYIDDIEFMSPVGLRFMLNNKDTFNIVCVSCNPANAEKYAELLDSNRVKEEWATNTEKVSRFK